MNKRNSKLFAGALYALFVLLSASAFSSLANSAEETKSPSTVGDIAAKHQDAILAQKYFSYNSGIAAESNNESVYSFTATGTVNLDGWSHYTSVAGGDGAVRQEYYVKDDLAFRYVTIEKDSFKPANDTSEGWEHVSPEIFHRDVSINPLYIFAQLLDNKEPAAESAEESKAKGCRALKSSWSENESNVDAGFCVAESGLATEFTANQIVGGNMRLTLKMTVTPLPEPETIAPPKKVQTLYDDEKRKEEDENKNKDKK